MRVEPQDFEAFYREVYPQLWRLAVAKTGSRVAGEDLVQDVLADASRRWEHVRSLDNPVGWARLAVLNRSISWWRRMGTERRAMTRMGVMASTTGTPEDLFADEELWTAIRALPTRQFQVVLLMWFEDLSVVQVADSLGCSPETVRTHWRRAKTRLAQQLTVPDEPQGDN